MFHAPGTQQSRFCAYCGRRRLCEMQGISFVHGALLLLTCGLYLPVLLYKLATPPFRCTRCGSSI